MNIWKLSVLTMITAVFAVSCAEDVGDIDRTDDTPYFDKSDFEGVWFTRSTLIDVPGTVGGVFVGVSSGMEKITWEITENALIGYQSYEEIPGFDSSAGGKQTGVTAPAPGLGYGKNPEIYKGRPIVSYRITKHFDIQRSYNSSTGEQGNVISENTSDRNWHERKYIRVDWSSESIGFLRGTDSRWIGGEDGEVDGLYLERGDIGDQENALQYFDFTSRLNYAREEVTARSSFYRLPEIERDYEPAFYDDSMMTKFGYFRTERWVYDRATEFTDSNIVFLANRHDIWENDYKRDEDGVYLRDARGLRIPTPMQERDPKPVVYYLNENFPENLLEEAGEEGVLGIVADYNKAYTRAAASVKGMTSAQLNETYGDMFVLCHSPVRDTDSEVCDPRSDALKEAQDNAPYLARDGDVRKSFIWWVDQVQGAGLLGYGPSYPDPETGELIAGTAYVYGGGVDSYAGRGVDVVRFANGDFTDEELRDGVDKLTRNLVQLDPNIDPRGRNLPQELAEMPIDQIDQLLPEGARNIFDQIQIDGFDDLVSKPGRDKLIRQKVKESGLDVLMMNEEYIRGMSEGEIDPTDMTDEEFDKMRKMQNPMDLDQTIRADELRRQEFAERNMYMAEFADDAVIGTALEFKGETDYDKIWKSIRARIFRGVMAHEIGHTVGLRHNFQGSWDTMNFFDKYWELRKENFKYPETLDELYSVSAPTDAQTEGGMTNYMYSSIMDYHSRFNGDFSGLGKYDHAAILFAYTFGTYEDIQVDNTNPVVSEPGFVEIYNAVPTEDVDLPGYQPIDAARYFHSFDDRYAASQHPLTSFHYTAVVDILMGGPDNLTDRSIVRYGPLLAQQKADDPERPVEVQYMFGSDEWRGAHLSADTWDLGADALEKTRYYIQNYETYYPLTHFRRDRANFSIGSAVNGAARTFFAMPNIYQRWLYSGQSGDQVRQNYYQIGALAGINFLANVVMKPEYGGYNENANGDFQLATLDPNGDSDLNIQKGEGRRLYTTYETDSGYYWFSRPEEIGNFWDSLFALRALSSNSSTRVLGADSGDFRSYALPYSLVFGEQLGQFVNAIYLETPDYMPELSQDDRIVPVKVIPNSFNFLTGQMNPTTKARLIGRGNFSTRVNAMLSAIMSFGSADYSKDFIDQARVFKLGNAEQTLPIDALCAQLGLATGCSPGTHKLDYFADPETGIVYGAIEKIGGEFNGQPDLGTELIRRGKVQTAIISSVVSSQADKDTAGRELRSIIEDIVLVSDMVKVSDNVLF